MIQNIFNRYFSKKSMNLDFLLQYPYWNAVLALVTLIIGIVLIKIVVDIIRSFFSTKGMRKVFRNFGFEPSFGEVIVSFFKYFLYIIVAMAAIAQFGFGILIFELVVVIIIAVVVIIIALSLKDFIANAGAGLYIKRNRIIKEGDIITINGNTGKVKRVDLITTLIIGRGKMIVVPNQKLIDKIIIKKVK